MARFPPLWVVSLVLALASCTRLCVGDIPVHVMGDEMLGTWNVKMTAASDISLYTDNDVCGHSRPDNYKTSLSIFDDDKWDNWWYDRLKDDDPRKAAVVIEEYVLHIPHLNMTGAELCPAETSGAGCFPVKFTAVYDEGILISVTLGSGVHIKMFILFKYEMKDKSRKVVPELSKLSKFVTLPDQSLSSFWSAHSSSVKQNGKYQFGCVIMKKTTPIKPHSSEALDMASSHENAEPVVSPHLLQTSMHAKIRSSILAALDAEQDSRHAEFMKSKASISEAHVNFINNGDFGYTASMESVKAFLQDGTNENVLARLGVSAASRSMQRLDGYIEELESLSHAASEASEQASTVGISATAEQHVMENIELYDPGAGLKETEQEASLLKIQTRCTMESLPKEFDWSDSKSTGCKDILPSARDQAACGSCYAFAAVTSATARYRIAHSPDPECASGSANADPDAHSVEFSPESIVRCSYANQGCDGGYPASAAYQMFAEGLYTFECDPYTGTDGQKTEDNKKCSAEKHEGCKRYYVDDFSYAGGVYGYDVNMAAMMRDLVQFGPMAVAIEAPPTLGAYKGGVFSPGYNRMKKTRKGKHSYFQKTNHAVTLIGFGVAKDQKGNIKYDKDGNPTLTWKIRNSWGDNWGDNGNFQIERGIDIIASETMPLAVRFTTGSSSKKGKAYIEAYEKCVADAQVAVASGATPDSRT